MVFFDCLNHISVIFEPFGLFLGSLENWRVGAFDPIPVSATTQPINPCGSVNPRQSLDPPSPLNQDDFVYVKFWTKSSWNSYELERSQKGATNGNAKKGKKHGRPEKETPNDDCDSLVPNTSHIYLEKQDGIPVSKALITQQGQKMRSLWATLRKHGLAPMVWSDADSFAVKFVDSAI